MFLPNATSCASERRAHGSTSARTRATLPSLVSADSEFSEGITLATSPDIAFPCSVLQAASTNVPMIRQAYIRKLLGNINIPLECIRPPRHNSLLVPASHTLQIRRFLRRVLAPKPTQDRK